MCERKTRRYQKKLNDIKEETIKKVYGENLDDAKTRVDKGRKIDVGPGSEFEQRIIEEVRQSQDQVKDGRVEDVSREDVG